MNPIKSITFGLDPSAPPAFLLDWELTKKCNLDCSYCAIGEFGGHDNSTQHPPIEECVKSIDFMYEYVDLYMQYRKESNRKVVLNVYGGESLVHPQILEILQQVKDKQQKYKHRWELTITCTTNGIVGTRMWSKIIPYIDEFIVSYHPENIPKQKEQYKKNILQLKKINKRFKCVMLMHNDKEMFDDVERMVQYCKDNQLPFFLKRLDNTEEQWAYTGKQFQKIQANFGDNEVEEPDEKVLSISKGRACCGGRKMCVNGNYKENLLYINKQGFKDWHCSVNWYFLFLRQYNGKVYSSTKDCLTNVTTNRVEPLGNIDNYQVMLDTLRTQLETKSMPVIKCVKSICVCGYCAPKAESRVELTGLLKHKIQVSVLKDAESN
jgi:sulfatase maturation enzyme AslB (radical SAM superfamily)